MLNSKQKETIKTWVEALRSGIYTPVKRSGNFYDDKDNSCGCGIGVLGKILNVPANALTYACEYNITDLTAKEKLQGELALTKVGIPKNILHEISEGYEQGMGFEEIAEFLEQNYLSEYAVEPTNQA